LDREVIDHGELGGSCSDDDVGPAFSLKGLTDTLGAEFGGGGPHFLWGRKDAEVNGCFIFHKIQWAFCWSGGGKQESRKMVATISETSWGRVVNGRLDCAKNEILSRETL
jgi:hypothetical protein